MAYVLYGARGSGSGIVEAACAEIGVDCELRDLDARNDEHRGDAYAAINPQRKMPALVIDGEVLTETLAILVTLDERHRAARLLPPPGSTDRATALRWMAFMASELYPLVEIIDYPERFAPSPDDAEAVRERAEAMWRERWRVIEGAIRGDPYLLVGGFSAADLYATKLGVWLDAEWRRAELPRLSALVDAVYARPRLREVWARHMPRGPG